MERFYCGKDLQDYLLKDNMLASELADSFEEDLIGKGYPARSMLKNSLIFSERR